MNRRQRRDATSKNHSLNQLSSASDIPLARPQLPTSSKPKAKTLFEIAAERQAELAPNRPPFLRTASQSNEPAAAKLLTLTSDGKFLDPDANAGENDPAILAPAQLSSSPLPPILDTLLLAAPLSSLHFTLSFLTFHQYAQQDLLSFSALLRETILIALPTLTLLIHLTHGHALPSPKIITPQIRSAFKIAQQLAFIITANIAGCYLIFLTNNHSYYAVMKRAPAIGTLWVWSILELHLVGALVGVAGPATFAWWNGYGIF